MSRSLRCIARWCSLKALQGRTRALGHTKACMRILCLPLRADVTPTCMPAPHSGWPRLQARAGGFRRRSAPMLPRRVILPPAVLVHLSLLLELPALGRGGLLYSCSKRSAPHTHPTQPGRRLPCTGWPHFPSALPQLSSCCAPPLPLSLPSAALLPDNGYPPPLRACHVSWQALGAVVGGGPRAPGLSARRSTQPSSTRSPCCP